MPLSDGEFEYGPDTTVGLLIRQYLEKHGVSAAALAERIGVTEPLMKRWLNNELTSGLVSSHFKRFQDATGIDIDRLIVLEAKRQLWGKGIPCSEQTFATRAEVVAELQKHCTATNCVLVGEQIGIPGGTIQGWLSGRQQPSLEYLPTIFKGFDNGFLPGTIDDVRYALIKRQLFKTEDPLADLPKFRDLINEIQRYQGAQEVSAFARWSHLHMNIIWRLEKFNEKSETTADTIKSMIRLVVSQRRRDLLPLFKKPWPEQRQRLRTTKQEPTRAEPSEDEAGILPPSAAQPAPPEPVTTVPALPEPPVTAPAPPPQQDLLLPVLERFAKEMAQLGGTGAELLTIVASLRTLPPAPAADGNQVVSGKEVVGTTLNGVRFCLTSDTFRALPGVELSETEIEDTVVICEELRRRMTVLLQCDRPVRTRVLRRLGKEIDELYSVMGLHKTETPSAALHMLAMERTGFAEMRENKDNGGES